MLFLKIFKTTAANVLINLKVIILELRKMQHDVERLLIMEQNMTNDRPAESIVNTIRDSFGVALWIKDLGHHIIFANKVCCETILNCKEDELAYITLDDFKKDALANECLKSDELVMKAQVTKRFIISAVYADRGAVFLDIINSPRIEAGELVGTIGSGVFITDSIPDGIRKQNRTSGLIEIPINTSMGTLKLIELLERRKVSRSGKESSETYLKQRKVKL